MENRKLKESKFFNSIWAPILTTLLLLVLASKVYPSVEHIWPIQYFVYLLLLVVLRSDTVLKFTGFSARDIRHWVSRISIICLVFSPLILLNALYKLFLGRTNSDNWWIAYFCFIGLFLWLSENYLFTQKRFKKTFKNIVRYAPAIIGVALFLMLISCFAWLYYHQDDDGLILSIPYIFDLALSISLPIFSFLPTLIIVLKTEKTEYLIKYYWEFYKILFINRPVLMFSICGLLLIPIGIVISLPGQDYNRAYNNLWLVTISMAPITMLLTYFSDIIKNYEKYFKADFHRKLNHIITTMNEHIIITGYGYLGKEILQELIERDIISNENAIEIITPELRIARIYTNLIIIDIDSNIISHGFSDTIYGNIGTILSESKVNINENDENFASALVASVVGDIVNNNTLNTARVKFSKLIISAIPDYAATNKLTEFMQNNKVVDKQYGIISCKDFYQLKSHLPIEKNTDQRLWPLYPSYLEGETLGRVAFAAASRWIEEAAERKKEREKEAAERRKERRKERRREGEKERRREGEKYKNYESLPKVVIVGGGKAIFYLCETYLIGLRHNYQRKRNTEDINVSILTQDKSYSTITTNQERSTQLGLKNGRLKLRMRSQSTTYTKYAVDLDIVFGDPSHYGNVLKIIKLDKPDIIIIAHKRADVVTKILEAWESAITYVNMEDYKPKIIVGTKGNEKTTYDHIETYAKQNNISDQYYPTQIYDAIVKVYYDTREQIGSIAEAITKKNEKTKSDPVSLYYCIANQPGSLAKLCNEFASLEGVEVDNYNDLVSDGIPSFYNTRANNCPGSKGIHTNNRILLESDIVLHEQLNNTDDSIAETNCKGLVITKENIEVIDGSEDTACCFDRYCIYRRTCGFPKIKDPETADHNNVKCVLAKIFVCANHYGCPGSIARVLNKLLFLITKRKPNNRVINLSYLRSYSTFSENLHKKEFHGNYVNVDVNGDDNNSSLNSPIISSIRILPLTEAEKWLSYSNTLTGFLNKHYQVDKIPHKSEYKCSPSYNEKNKVFDIRIEHVTHKQAGACPETCPMGMKRKVV